MKTSNFNTWTFLCLVILLVSPSMPALTQADSLEVEYPALREEIIAMAESDRMVHMQIMQKAINRKKPNASDLARRDSVIGRNLIRAKEILEKHKWPGYQQVGERGSHDFYLLVFRAENDREFQKYALPFLKEAYENGNASGENLAYLTDVVRVAEGQPQVYGTKVHFDNRTCPKLGEIENPDEVDARRAKMGLEPIDEKFGSLLKGVGRKEFCQKSQTN